MNPYQKPESEPAAALFFDETKSAALRRFTGNYFRILGWIGLTLTAASIATSYWTDSLDLDITFILWFWLGNSLRKGYPGARIWAIAIFVIFTGFIGLGSLLPGFKAKLGGYEFDHSHPLFHVIGWLLALVFSIPGVMLLGAKGRAAFPEKEFPTKEEGTLR